MTDEKRSASELRKLIVKVKLADTYRNKDETMTDEILKAFIERERETIRREWEMSLWKVIRRHSCDSCGPSDADGPWVQAWHRLASSLFNAVKTGMPLTQEEFHAMLKQAVEEEKVEYDD